MRASYLAQGYNVAVSAGLQFITTPVLLTAWGVDSVGAWLIGASIGAYAALSELGFSYAAKTRLVIATAGQRLDQAAVEFAAAAAAVVVGNCALVGAALVLFFGFPSAVAEMLGQSQDVADVKVAIALLVVNGLLQTHTLLLSAAQRAVFGPASEAARSTTIRLVETAVMLCTALASDSLALAAASMCCVRITGNWFLLRAVRRSGLVGRSLLGPLLPVAWDMAPSAMAHLILPLAQALWIQLPVVVLGSMASSKEVVQYVAMRTVARIGTTLGNLLNNVHGPEYSLEYGAGRVANVPQLIRRHLAGVALLAVAIGVGAFTFGEAAVDLLTRDHVGMAAWPFVFLTAGVILEIFWTAVFTGLAALNMHVRVAVMILVAAVASALLLVPAVNHLGLLGATVAPLAGNIIAAAAVAIAMQRAQRQLQDVRTGVAA